MPKSQEPGHSKQVREVRGAGPPPEQAEVERAIGVILDRLKPKKLDRKASRARPR